MTAWPDGVIARYLTVAGSTVDVRKDDGADGTCYHNTCNGCGDRPMTFYGYGDDPSDRLTQALNKARADAQGHAERCRAIPRPA